MTARPLKFVAASIVGGRLASPTICVRYSAMRGDETRYVLYIQNQSHCVCVPNGPRWTYPEGKYTTAGEVVVESHPMPQRAPLEMAALGCDERRRAAYTQSAIDVLDGVGVVGHSVTSRAVVFDVPKDLVRAGVRV